MAGIWGAFDELEEDAEEELGSFGGVTATDFFGLLLVAMFTLTLLAALTLGVRGQFERTAVAAEIGGVNTADEGIKSASTYKQLTAEVMLISEGALHDQGRALTPALVMSVGDDLGVGEPPVWKDMSVKQLVDLRKDANVGVELYRRLSIASWNSLASKTFADSRNISLTVTIPSGDANFAVDTTQVRRKVKSIRPDADDLTELRQLLWYWQEGKTEEIQTLFPMLVDSDVRESLLNLAILHLRWNYRGKINYRYFVVPRKSPPDSDTVEITVDLTFLLETAEVKIRGE